MDLDEALETIGLGWAHVWIWFCCSMLSMTGMNETMGMSIIVVVSQCDLGTSSREKSLMSSAALAGMTLSALYLGFQADISGRRKVLLFTLWGNFICSTISAFMPHVYPLTFMRFLCGLFLAGPASLYVAYITEFCPPKWRPSMTNLVSYMVGVSLIFCPLVAKYFLPLDFSVHLSESYELRTWRFLMLLYMSPCIVALLVMSFLPETPSYLLSVERNEEAFAVVTWLCRMNRRKEPAELNIWQINEAARPNSLHKHQNLFLHVWSDSVVVLKPPYLRYFLICALLMFGMFLNSIGLGVWYPLLRNQDNSGGRPLCTILANVSMSAKRRFVTLSKDLQNVTEVVEECDDVMHNFADPIIYGFSYLGSYVLVTILLRLISRKHMICLFVAAAALAGLLLNFLRYSTLILACFTAQMVLPGVMISQVASVLVDCIPTQLRGKALCLCRAFARMGGILGNFCVGLLLQVSCYVTINLFNAYMAFCILLALMLPS